MINIVRGVEIGVKPYELNAEVLVGEEKCYYLELFSSMEGNEFLIEDRWSKKIYESREVRDYYLTGDELGIYAIYNLSVKMDLKILKVPICFKSYQPRRYFGLILIHSANGVASLGVWANVLVKEIPEEETDNTNGVILALTSQSILMLSLASLMAYTVLLSK